MHASPRGRLSFHFPFFKWSHPNVLTLEQINAIRVLIARATLKGDEVPTYNEVVAALSAEEYRVKQSQTGAITGGGS
jgi:hypothetical protein